MGMDKPDLDRRHESIIIRTTMEDTIPTHEPIHPSTDMGPEVLVPISLLIGKRPTVCLSWSEQSERTCLLGLPSN